jgi:hypothetical protein
MSYKVDIIVSRFNESLEWMNEEPFNNFRYIVYNKGENENLEKKYIKSIINLPNVGRCDHTYLFHIVNNFDNLANINVFFPGSLNIEHKKEKAKKILHNILKYKKAIFCSNISVKGIKNEFENFVLDEWQCSELSNKSLNNESKLLPALIRPFGNWFKFHFGDIKVKYYTLNGIFSIQKMDILKHDINRYKKLLSGVQRHSNPEVGHFLERSWAAVFHPLLFTKILPEYKYIK